MKRPPARLLWALLAVSLSACTARTTLTAVQSATTVAVKTSSQTATPRTETLQATSFGNFEFRAEGPAGEPLYGVLPLKFNGGYLALDILFFAPAAFFNLREPFTFYEFDLDKRVVRYRNKPTDEWVIYMPHEDEAARSKRLFSAPK